MARLDTNGYAETIMPSEGCYFCGSTDIVRHEIFPGRANRKISKENGFWVTLCPTHHMIVHQNEEYAKKWLKKPCMERYLENHSREEWRKLIGVFYE